MRPAEQTYHRLLSHIVDAKRPRIPFISSVWTTIVSSAKDLDASYWALNLVSPVHFSGAMKSILEIMPGSKIFLEIGPHSALAGPVRQIIRHWGSRKDEYIHTLLRRQDSHRELLNCIGQLYCYKHPVDLSPHVGKGNFLNDLPLYPWHYEQPLWTESRLSKEWRFRTHPHHDLLGSRVLETTSESPAWRNVFRLDELSWLKEHEVAGVFVFPAVGFVSMAGEAIRQLTGVKDFTVKHLNIKTALVFNEAQDCEVVTHLNRLHLTSTLDSEWFEFSVSSLTTSTWVKHAFGKIKAETDCTTLSKRLKAMPRALSKREWYRKMKQMGLSYGSRFSGLTGMTADPSSKMALATIRNEPGQRESAYTIHPATLDCVLQLIIPTAYNGRTRLWKHLALPTYIDELCIREPPVHEIQLQAIVDEESRSTLSGSVIGISGGRTVIEFKGIQTSTLEKGEQSQSLDPHAALELEWKEDLNFANLSINSGNHSEISNKNEKGTSARNHLEAFAIACMTDVENSVKIMTDNKSALRYAPQTSMEALKALHVTLRSTDSCGVANMLLELTKSMREMTQGLTNDSVLSKIEDALRYAYEFEVAPSIARFLDLLTHRKPNLRVLEIGTTARSVAPKILPLLRSSYGERLYFSYTYATTSEERLKAARDELQAFERTQFKLLDLSGGFLDPGLAGESYDLIIACKVRSSSPPWARSLTWMIDGT